MGRGGSKRTVVGFAVCKLKAGNILLWNSYCIYDRHISIKCDSHILSCTWN